MLLGTEEKRIHIISVPFEHLTMPSVDIATLKSCLQSNGVDVVVDVLYPKYAAFIGGAVYGQLQNSIVGDAVFSSLLFPQYADALKEKISSQIAESEFEKLIEETKSFFGTLVDDLMFSKNDIAFFHIYTKQLLPAVYVAGLVYQRYNLPIWFSGYHCIGECGESLQKMFPYIERVFGRDIEVSVINALRGEGNRISLALDDLPTPDYSDFVVAHQALHSDFKEKYIQHFWYQVEFSRGCWWGKCAFCSLHCPYTKFQARSIENIIRDYRHLQKEFSTTQILVTEFNSDSDWRDLVSRLNSEFPGLRGTYYLLFKVSALQSESDWKFLRDNDVPILVGVESLSAKALAKIDKGQTVIECIQVLKYAERYGVKCCYNLMCGLPFETEEDYIETKRIIPFIRHCLPPFDLEFFRLTSGSPIYRMPEKYNIRSMGIRKNIEGILLPPDIQKDYKPFFLDFESTIPGLEERKSRWTELIQEWADFYYRQAKTWRPQLHSIFYARRNDHVLELFDGRDGAGYKTYVLSGLQKAIYEYCDSIHSTEDILNAFSAESQESILSILNDFTQRNLMFKEDANYLSLAI